MIPSSTPHEASFGDRVLVVGPDPDLCERLAYNLEVAGCTVHVADNGRAGLAEAEGFAPEVVLLDLALPDVPGAEVCRRIRASARQPAIVVLAEEELSFEASLRASVQGYVVKPLSVSVVVKRVDAILRARELLRASVAVARAPRRRYVVGRLEVDVDGYHVLVDGQKVPMAAMEMRLLIHFVEHLGLVRSRAALLTEVWGYAPGVSTRTLDTHVKSLRAKLGAAGALVETVRGMGYRLSDE